MSGVSGSQDEYWDPAYAELFDGGVSAISGDDFASAVKAVPSGPGVCLLTDAAGQPVLLVQAAGLRSVVRHRLSAPQADEPTRRADLRPVTRTLWWRRTYSPFETEWAYLTLAQAVYPDSFRALLPKLQAWFITINDGAAYPFFRRTDSYEPQGGAFWGPFAQRSDADRVLDTITDVFDLCRCPEVLADAPQARPCSYAQMGRCVAVCDGSATLEAYRAALAAARSFLDRNSTDNAACLDQQMRQAAAARAYERAGRFKKAWGVWQSLGKSALRWFGPMSRFRVLAFHRGPKVKTPGRRGLEPTVSAFLIGPGWVTQLAPFTLAEAVAGCRALLDHYHYHCLCDHRQAAVYSPEVLAWTARLLYKDDGGLYLRGDEAPLAAELAAQVEAHFTAESTKTDGRPALNAATLAAQAADKEDDDQA